MRDETELKFEVPKESLGQLKASRWFKGNPQRKAKNAQLVSVYFDTDNLKLRRKGVSLRVRHTGEARVQTIKVEGQSTAGVFSPKEWEHRIRGDEPDLKAAAGTPLQRLFKKKLRRALRPMFETRVERMIIPVRLDGAEIELAVDHGQISTSKNSAPLIEVELELKRGKRSALLDLAQDLSKAVPASLVVQSKADRGFALLNGTVRDAVHAGEIVLEPGATTEQAFRAIGFSCLRHFASNEAAVRASRPDGVHQMRVGLRRLRAAISLFSELLNDSQTEAIKGELKWLGTQLGAARDLDVFVCESLPRLRHVYPSNPGMEALQTDLQSRRLEAFQHARSAVDSARYRLLLLNTLSWLEAGEWTKENTKLARVRRNRPIQPFAAEILSQRAKRVIRKGSKLERLDPHQRHRLRIRIKKLRYATEFFDNLFPGKKSRKSASVFQSRLKELQDCLGKLNDISVHEKIATEILHSNAPRDAPREREERAFAAGLVSGRQQSSAAPALAAAVRASARLGRLRPFWK